MDIQAHCDMTAFNESEPRDAHGRWSGDGDTQLGTVMQVSGGRGFNKIFLTVVKAQDGWHKVLNYALQGNTIPQGQFGELIDISGMSEHGVLHEGIGKSGRISNILQIAALPDGSKILQKSKLSVGDKIYEKKDGKWYGPEGKGVEYYHFDPNYWTYEHVTG